MLEKRLGEKIYRFQKLTVGDMDDLFAWARKMVKASRREVIADAKEVFGEGKIPAKIVEQFSEPITGEQIAAELNSFSGALRAILLSLKHDRSDVTLEEIKPHITAALLEEITAAIFDNEDGDKKKQGIAAMPGPENQ